MLRFIITLEFGNIIVPLCSQGIVSRILLQILKSMGAQVSYIKQPNSVPYLQALHPRWVESADAESGGMEDHCVFENRRIFPLSKSIIKCLGSNGGCKLFAILKIIL